MSFGPDHDLSRQQSANTVMASNCLVGMFETETYDARPAAATSTAERRELAGMSIGDDVSVLVVDDSADLVEAIGLLLQSRGYSVRTATNGAEALALISREAPHCVILDVRMPQMDGHEFSSHLRAQYRDDIVLIAISGHAATEPEVSATFSIVDHYLQKPIDFNELNKILPSLA